MFKFLSTRRSENGPAAEAAAFASDCQASSVELQADRVREGCGVFASPGGDAIEAMIVAGAYDSAALALVGADRPFVLSRGGSGQCMATLIVSRTGAEVSAVAASPALALLAAAALAIVEEARVPASPRRHRFYTHAAHAT